MKLIREFTSFEDIQVISEDMANGKKSWKIIGPFIEAQTKNKNGRIYPQQLIEREVKNYNENYIKTGKAIGELSHPATPEINLDRVSHIIEDIYMDKNIGIGKAKLINTPMGLIAQSLLEAGVKIGVSTRGVGSLSGNVVNEDFRLITVDIVSNPSAPSAWVDGIMENKEYIVQGDQFVEVAISNMKKTLDKQGSKVIKEALEQFLKSIG